MPQTIIHSAQAARHSSIDVFNPHASVQSSSKETPAEIAPPQDTRTPQEISQLVLKELAEKSTPINEALIASVTDHSLHITEFHLSQSSESSSDCSEVSSSNEGTDRAMPSTPEKSPHLERPTRSYREFGAFFTQSTPDFSAAITSKTKKEPQALQSLKRSPSMQMLASLAEPPDPETPVVPESSTRSHKNFRASTPDFSAAITPKEKKETAQPSQSLRKSPSEHMPVSLSTALPDPVIPEKSSHPERPSRSFKYFFSQTTSDFSAAQSSKAKKETAEPPHPLIRSPSEHMLGSLSTASPDPVTPVSEKSLRPERPASKISRGIFSHSNPELGPTINLEELSTQEKLNRSSFGRSSSVMDYSSPDKISDDARKSDPSSKQEIDPPKNAEAAANFFQSAASMIKASWDKHKSKAKKAEAKSANDLRAMNRSASARRLSYKKDEILSSPLAMQQTRKIQGQLDYFISMRLHKIFYKVEIAEKELSKCLGDNTDKLQREIILQLVLDLHKDPKNHERLYEVLSLALLKKENMAFIQSFLRTNKPTITPFAEAAVDVLIRRKIDLLPVILHATEFDLERETPKTVFRDTCLSSALSKVYGKHLWEKELKELDHTIHREFNRWPNPSLLTLDSNAMSQLLEQNDPDFKKLPADKQNEAIAREVEHHAENFRQFAFPILAAIYSMKIPSKFSQLLQMRRNCIIAFLKAHPDPSNPNEDLNVSSRITVSGDLFLRLLNPHLSQDFNEQHPKWLRIMLHLAKFTQNLANEVRFGQEKREPVYELLNPLFDTFIKTHRDFIDKSSK